MKRSLFIAAAVVVIVGFVLVTRMRSAPQDRDAMIAEARKKAEEYQKTALRIDELAGSIHSEEDARAFVDAMGQAFADQIPYSLTAPLRARVATAEYAAVSDPAKLIPEQRVVDAWNHWIADINGPKEARLTVAELHVIRENYYFGATSSHARQYRALWSLSNIYAVKPNGRVADACRPVEAFLLLHQIDMLFINVVYARDFIAQGKSMDEDLRRRAELDKSTTRTEAHLVAMPENPVQAQLRHAEGDYFEKHGEITMGARVLQLVSEVLGN
jgi:hypothetical protein